MSNPTLKSGFRTRLEIRSIAAGAQATLEALAESEATVLSTTADLASKTLEQSSLADQIAALNTDNTGLEEQQTYYEEIMAGSADGEPEYEAAEAARAIVVELQAENTDLIAALTTTKSAVDIEVTDLTADLVAAEAERDGHIAVLAIGVWETVPVVEEFPDFPTIKAEMDGLIPIDGSTNGFPVTVPTGTFENSEFKVTMGLNKDNAIHDRLERAAMLHDLIEARITATDGRVYSFNMRVSEFKRKGEAKKINRAEVSFMLDGAITMA